MLATGGVNTNSKVAKYIMNSLISFSIEVSNNIGENTKNTNDNNPIVIYNE